MYVIVWYVWFDFLWRTGRFQLFLMTFTKPLRCCCFPTFLWISSLKLQTLLSAFWTVFRCFRGTGQGLSYCKWFCWSRLWLQIGLTKAASRHVLPLTLAGSTLFRLWHRTPLHIVFLDSLPHLQKQQADDSWVVLVSRWSIMWDGISEDIRRISGLVLYIYVRSYMFLLAIFDNMCLILFTYIIHRYTYILYIIFNISLAMWLCGANFLLPSTWLWSQMTQSMPGCLHPLARGMVELEWLSLCNLKLWRLRF